MLRTGFGDTMQTRRLWAVICLTVLMGPLVGSLTVPPSDYIRLENEAQILPEGQTLGPSRNRMDGAGLLTNVHGGSDRRLTKMETASMIRSKIQIS